MSEIRIGTPPRRRGRRGGLYLLILLIVIVAGASLWTWLTLAWAYADGTRAGVLQKVTRRGWFCKTIEGDLAQYIVPGISPQVWRFSVRDPAVAAQLEKIVGRQVQLHYTEHPGAAERLLRRHPVLRGQCHLDRRAEYAGFGAGEYAACGAGGDGCAALEPCWRGLGRRQPSVQLALELKRIATSRPSPVR